MSGPKIDGAWKTPASVYVKIEGVWKIAAQTYSKIDGVWKETTLSSPPPQPVLEWVSGETFRIVGYNSSLVYQATLVSGSGTSSLNTSTGRYVVSSSGAYKFNITASYAVGALVSTPGFMEKKLYSYGCRDATFQQPYDCNCATVGGDCGCLPPGPNGCPPGSSPNGQCGCGNTFPTLPCMFGSIGTVVCGTCYREACCVEVCDVLVNEPGYTNSGSAWYRTG